MLFTYRHSGEMDRSKMELKRQTREGGRATLFIIALQTCIGGIARAKSVGAFTIHGRGTESSSSTASPHVTIRALDQRSFLKVFQCSILASWARVMTV